METDKHDFAESVGPGESFAVLVRNRLEVDGLVAEVVTDEFVGESAGLWGVWVSSGDGAVEIVCLVASWFDYVSLMDSSSADDFEYEKALDYVAFRVSGQTKRQALKALKAPETPAGDGSDFGVVQRLTDAVRRLVRSR